MAVKYFPTSSEGEFKLEKIKPITKLLTPQRCTFVKPDYFDNEGNWYRLLQDNQGLIAVKINNSGIVSWSSSSNHDSAQVKNIVKNCNYSALKQ